MSSRHPVSPVGLHRVLEPSGVLPQAAWKLDASPELVDGEIRVRVRRLNLDAASFRQLSDKHHADGDKVRAEVLDRIRTRGKRQNPVTGFCIFPRVRTMSSTSARTRSPSPWCLSES